VYARTCACVHPPVSRSFCARGINRFSAGGVLAVRAGGERSPRGQLARIYGGVPTARKDGGTTNKARGMSGWLFLTSETDLKVHQRNALSRHSIQLLAIHHSHSHFYILPLSISFSVCLYIYNLFFIKPFALSPFLSMVSLLSASLFRRFSVHTRPKTR